MRNSIVRAYWACLRTLLNLCLPGKGRHRPVVKALNAPEGRIQVPVSPAPLTTPRSPYGAPEPLQGEDVRLVRPYVTAHERRQQVHVQITRERRIALLLATHGLDVGPTVIHGVRLPF